MVTVFLPVGLRTYEFFHKKGLKKTPNQNPSKLLTGDRQTDSKVLRGETIEPEQPTRY